jgi:hypothetical protein
VTVQPDRPTAAILSVMCLLGAVLLAQAITLRDENQELIHQRDVAPQLQRCEARP